MTNIDTSWVKFREIKAIAFLGKDVIAFASGIHVIFINLNTKDEKVEKFDNRERSDGACCLSGHPVIPMFAIAERCLNPRISIFTYPKINKVSTCIYKKIKRLNGYLSSTFAGTEYLITLTSFPDFQLIIWLWRSGENLKVIDTKITDDIQQITSSILLPFWFTQLGENTGQLMIYEMTVCSKIVLLNATSNFISNERIISTSWTCDGNLLLCDELGNISIYYTDGKRSHVIVESKIQTAPKWRPLVVGFRGGAVVVNTLSQILFYRKSTIDRSKSVSFWKLIWKINTNSHPVFIIRHIHRDSLLFYTLKGEIIEVSVGDDDVPRMQTICYQSSEYLFLVSINPDGRIVGVIDTFSQLIMLESHNGNLLSITSLDNYGKILQVVAHKSLPLIVMSTDTGKCNIISVVEVEKPVVIKSFYLIEKPLEKLKFSMIGDILGVASITNGELFIINEFIDVKFNVLTMINVSIQIVDFLIYKIKNRCLVILVLIKSDPIIYIGKNIVVYNVNELTLESEAKRIIELPNIFKSLHYGESNNIIASPYLKKQLYIMKINKDFETIALTDALSLSHQLRDININTESRLILTFGYDGIIIVKSKINIHLTIDMFLSYHRKECGVKFAIASLYQNMILCLDRNGNLVATKLNQLSTVPCSSENLIDNNIDYTDAINMLSRFTPIKLAEEKTWVELKHEEQLEKEYREMKLKRELILQKFYNLRIRLKELLDANETESDDVKLNIATFNLAIARQEEKMKINFSKKQKLIKDLEEKIHCHNKLTTYIREMYWESMRIHTCSLISLDSKICVDNYPLPVDNLQEGKNNWKLMNLSTDISKQVLSTEQMILNSTDEYFEMNNKFFSVNKHNELEKFARCGTTSYRWIREHSANIFNQINRGEKCAITNQRENKLKEYFNNQFEEMQMKKSEEIKLAKKRISRIEHCLSELKKMFGIEMCINYDNLCLDWHITEQPENIIMVKDSEVYKSINISMGYGSNINCINDVDNVVEKKTLDNPFWDEMLEKFMDGVLEFKWEDEIKRDILKPDCLLKNVENYTQDELKMIKAYEKSVKNLKIQRLKYKSILEKEISEIQELLRKDIENFNSKLKSFFLERIKIESAILQENLMSLCQLQRNQLQQESIVQIKQIEIDELALAINEVKKFTNELTILEFTVNEIKNRYENLIKREKLLEGKFRGEFLDLKQPMVEHLLRHYKKRPRIGQLICTSVTYLTEMSKCIMSGEKSEILPRQCIEFLKGMQSIDVMPSSLPSQIDSNHWFILCRIRRAKVEIEIRLKSCAVELAEAEQTLIYHQKTIQNAQNRVQQLNINIDNIKSCTCEILRNMELQLVLKMGQIEIHLVGDSSELDNVVLVSFDEVLRVNDAIVRAGRDKVSAMNKTIVFRRNIEWREWRHRCMKLTLDDMREELKVLQDMKVTKEIQKYLMRHLHMIGASKDTETWERNHMSTKKVKQQARYIEMMDNEKEKLINITKTINEWRKKNDRFKSAITKLKLANLKLSLLVNDDTRVRDEKFHQAKLKAIMKRNCSITKVQNNYEDLLTLKSELEVLRLKTYPTLRLKDLMRDQKRLNNNENLKMNRTNN